MSNANTNANAALAAFCEAERLRLEGIKAAQAAIVAEVDAQRLHNARHCVSHSGVVKNYV